VEGYKDSAYCHSIDLEVPIAPSSVMACLLGQRQAVAHSSWIAWSIMHSLDYRANPILDGSVTILIYIHTLINMALNDCHMCDWDHLTVTKIILQP